MWLPPGSGRPTDTTRAGSYEQVLINIVRDGVKVACAIPRSEACAQAVLADDATPTPFQLSLASGSSLDPSHCTSLITAHVMSTVERFILERALCVPSKEDKQAETKREVIR